MARLMSLQPQAILLTTFFSFGMYVMYISIFLHMLMYKDIEKFMSLHPHIPASPTVAS
jgi:hypothetical protein